MQDKNVKMGRIQIFNNWSPYMVKQVKDTVWLGLEYFCDEGDAFWSMDEEDCIKQARAELKKIGFISEDTKILFSHRQKVKKARPPPPQAPGVLFLFFSPQSGYNTNLIWLGE